MFFSTCSLQYVDHPCRYVFTHTHHLRGDRWSTGRKIKLRRPHCQMSCAAAAPSIRLLVVLALAASCSAGGSVWEQRPFGWGTVQDKLYSFCSNASGALAPDALSALACSKMMIHGMEEGASLPPAWRGSESKIGLAAKQLRAVNPQQLQLYTVQIDYARSVYTSGQWFYAHPECLSVDSNGTALRHEGNAHPQPGSHNECSFGANASYPGYCPVYGFQTQCGRDNWVRLIVESVVNNSLDGVFIDGFQGCAIDDAKPGAQGCCPGGSQGSTCSPPQRTAWMLGLRQALWALKDAFTKLGKKTIICNKTGGTYACGKDATRCFCDASNSERYGGGPGGVVQLMDYHKLNPKGGVIVHVPHINAGEQIFNQALAGFLLGAHDGDGFGIGFQYECRRGGWLDIQKHHGILSQKLGQPDGDAKISIASWPGAQCTYTTPARPKPGRGLETGGCLMSRSFASGTRVFLGALRLARTPHVYIQLSRARLWPHPSFCC
jgi:hypothetical protein